MPKDLQSANDLFEENLERVLSYIREYVAVRRIPPSQREIAAACHLSKGSVIRCLDVLQARKRIARNLGQPRTIRLLSPEDEEQQKK